LLNNLEDYKLQPIAFINLHKGIRWVADHLPLFTPQDAADPQQMKSIAELALMYRLINRWHPTLRIDAFKLIESFLEQALCDPLPVYIVLQKPWHYNYYLGLYLIMRAAGHHNELWEEALTRLKSQGYPDILESSPYRKLENRYYHALVGIRPHHKPHWKSSEYRATTLGKCRNPIRLTTLESYSVTHTLFYLTDFSESDNSVPEKERKRIMEIVKTLLFHYWRKRNWDMSGELLLNSLALQRDDIPWFNNAAFDLLNAWRSDGALPGPSFQQVDITMGSNDSLQAFPHLYHTTLVGILFCAAYLFHSKRGVVG
jgi:hypothetical protein